MSDIEYLNLVRDQLGRFLTSEQWHAALQMKKERKTVEECVTQLKKRKKKK